MNGIKTDKKIFKKSKIELINYIKEKYNMIKLFLDEHSRRIWAWPEAKMIGRWWQILVAEATWIHKNTVLALVKEINNSTECIDKLGIRKKWGWRKSNLSKDEDLQKDIEEIINSSTRWDPESPLLRCSKDL